MSTRAGKIGKSFFKIKKMETNVGIYNEQEGDFLDTISKTDHDLLDWREGDDPENTFIRIFRME